MPQSSFFSQYRKENQNSLIVQNYCKLSFITFDYELPFHCASRGQTKFWLLALQNWFDSWVEGSCREPKYLQNIQDEF